MASITGGSGSGGTEAAAGAAAAVHAAPAPTSSEQRLAQALLRCMGRWGLAKTTIEDIAREAGMSRATAYRLYPGGKTAILDAALAGEVCRLVEVVSVEAAAATDLEDCLVRVVHTAADFLARHDALCFVQEHEPVVFEQYLGWDRLDALFRAAGDLLVPVLAGHLEPAEARRTGVWLARIVVSHLQTPSATTDLTDTDGARRMVTDFVLPGLAGRIAPVPTHDDRTDTPRPVSGPNPRS
jgi:AcrR family transcriptional regulator